MKSCIWLTVLVVVFLVLAMASTNKVARNDKEFFNRVVKLEKANEAMKKAITVGKCAICRCEISYEVKEVDTQCPPK